MKTLSTRLDAEIKRRFAEKAEAQGLTASDCLRRLIYGFLEVGFPEMPDLRRLDGVDERISGIEGKIEGPEGIGAQIEGLRFAVVGLVGLWCRAHPDDSRVLAPRGCPSVDRIEYLGRQFNQKGYKPEEPGV